MLHIESIKSVIVPKYVEKSIDIMDQASFISKLENLFFTATYP